MDVQGKKHYTDLPSALQTEMKTERQWAKQGYLPVNKETGVELYPNWYRIDMLRYFHISEVRRAEKEELNDYFAPERERLVQLERERKENKRKAEEEKRRAILDRVDSVEGMLQAVRQRYISLCEELGAGPNMEMPPTARKRVVIDTETTGLDPSVDELLQVSVLDADSGQVLYNEYFRPMFLDKWPEAEAVNHISPAMVADKRCFAAAVPELSQLLDSAEVVIGYNTPFDLDYLWAYGVRVGDKEIIDVMEDYAERYGVYDEEKGRYRWVKLTECAAALGYDWGLEQAHDSLADCRATLYCYKNM